MEPQGERMGGKKGMRGCKGSEREKKRGADSQTISLLFDVCCH